jgi:hypothetical protein
MAVVWLRKCPGLSVGQQSQTAKVPKVTSAPSARIYRLTPSLARLLIPLFHATYAGYTATCYRTAIAQRSTDRRHFKAGHYLLVFSALVSVSIYRRELSYKHAAQIYHQLGSQRRQGLRNWQHSGNFSARLNSVGLIRPGIRAGLAVSCVSSRLSCDASLSRKLANLLVLPMCDTRVTLWQLLGTKLCWAGVFCVTLRLSCDSSSTRKSRPCSCRRRVILV